LAAQTTSETEPIEKLPRDLKVKLLLQKADELLTSLEKGLAQRPLQLATLQSNLQKANELLADSKKEIEDWKVSWGRSEESRASLEAALGKMQSSYDGLMQRFNLLSDSMSAYQKEMQGQVHDLQGQKDLWKALAWGASTLLLVDLLIRLVSWIASLIA
jgi:chromosome segregation ATPase